MTTPYDQVPYPGYTHPQTHPNRLATIGALFGMQPAPVERCRVLELGCSDGNNLIPMAFHLPESHFIGIDLAGTAIARGQNALNELGLRNIELAQGDILEFPSSYGTFDYIIAHGIYAWVPAHVRDALLRVCRAHLAPQGIAFVSYNAYPGGHVRTMLRELMQFHIQQFADSTQRLKQAMALIKFLSEAREQADVYAQLLKDEAKQILEYSPNQLYHDELAEHFQPVYFHQFYAHAKRHGLEYVGEANFMEMQDHVFTEATRASLRALAHNRIVWEQYLDFLKCRRFRQTLLCHQEVKLHPQPQMEKLREFYLGSVAKPDSPDAKLDDGSVVKFLGRKNAWVQTDFPLAKAALGTLGELWPQTLQFAELLDRTRQRLGTPSAEAEESTLSEILLHVYRTGMLDVYMYRPSYCATPGQFPLASPLARWQVRRGDDVTNAWHTQVEVADEIGRQLLLLLDGTRDRPALLNEMRAWLEKSAACGSFADLETQLDDNLKKVARLGLLVR